MTSYPLLTTDVFGQWVGVQTTAGTTAIWTNWVSQTSTATTVDIYATWASQATNQLGMLANAQAAQYQQFAARERVLQQQHYQAVRITQAEIDAQAHRTAIANAKTRDAEERARVLLVANLSLREQMRLEKENAFVVRGSSGCRYRIRKGRTGNIDVLDRSGRITARLCAHPGIWVPDYDTMLAQKLSLENDDAAFLRIANRHAHRGETVAEAE